MPTVTLKEVNRENWQQALALAVHPEQEHFIPPVAVSIAKGYIRPEGPEVTPYAVYDGDQMVGFMNVVAEPRTTDIYWINGFLIDRAYQRQGYGRAALEEAVALIARKFPRCECIHLTVHPENPAAQQLYQSLGFKDTGNLLGEERIYRLDVPREYAPPYVISLEEKPVPADEKFVHEGLSAYNHTFTGDDSFTKLDVFLRDQEGKIAGGLLGGTYWGWLYVAILWIREDLRGQGYGQRMLAAAEAKAYQRGCHHVHLDTMSFQALPFYQKLGFALFGELHDIPLGHSRYFLEKPLAPAEAPDCD